MRRNPIDQPAPADQRAKRLDANPWLIFAVIGIGSFLGPLSGSITNVALPTIGSHFNADVQSVKWVVLVYLVVNTFLLPLAGKWSQRFGAARLYWLGFVLYGVGSLLCAMSEPYTLYVLVAARIVQACGSALLFANAGTLVTHFIPEKRRGLAFGLVGSIVSVALVTGPVLGGFICTHLDWTWIFWVQVPVAAAGFLSSVLLLSAEEPVVSAPFPTLSAVAWIVLIAGLALVGEAYSKGLWIDYVWLTGSLALLAALGFYTSERRGPSLFDYSMFRLAAFRLGTAGALMLNLTLFILLLFLPFYLEVYLGLPQSRVGLVLGISPLAGFVFGPSAGHFADRLGYRLPVLSGMGLMVLGFGALAGGVSLHLLWLVGLSMALLGAGSGMYGGPNFAAMMSSVSPLQRPLASSVGSLTRNIGFMAGTSLGSIGLGRLLAQYGGPAMMLAARTQELTPQTVPLAAFSYAFSRLAMFCCILSFVGVLGNLRFPNRIPARPREDGDSVAASIAG